MKKVLLILSLLIIFIPKVHADEKAVVNVFYKESCIHCKDLHSYLDELSEDVSYKDMFKVNYMEVSDKKNGELFEKVRSYFNVSSSGVPFYVIGEAYNVGFPNPKSEDEYMKKQFEARSKEIKDMIKSAYANDETNIVEEIKKGNLTVKTTRATTIASESKKENNEDIQAKVLDKKKDVMDYTAIAAVLLLITSSLLILKKKRG